MYSLSWLISQLLKFFLIVTLLVAVDKKREEKGKRHEDAAVLREKAKPQQSCGELNPLGIK
jgi:hypothetical protein